ncbi:HlyC/CorC family transporter, partial [bacterium]|nr:HlyC/CorC family transporter [bacterium]
LPFMNISETLRYLIGISLLLMCSFFFSGSETALTALTKTQIERLRRDKKKSSQSIIRFLDEPRRLFITVLFGNTLVNMAFVSITGLLVYNTIFKGKHPGFAYMAAIFSQTLLLLVFGEITPKTYAVNHPEKVAKIVARTLWFFSCLILPFGIVLRWFTDLLLSLLGVRFARGQATLTSDEIRAIVKSTEESGALQGEEGEIIHNIFELNDIFAKEIMVPRTGMVCVDVSKTIKDAFAVTKKAGYSRIPVYRKTIDNICGIFYVKDLPRWKGLRIEGLHGKCIEELTIEDFLLKSNMLNKLNPGNENTLIRPPLFTIKNKKVGPLLREMTKERQQMAILLDEFGGVTGLITVEDIVQEVFGGFFDEYDKVSELTIRDDPGDPYSVIIPGFVSIRSVNRRLQLKLDPSVADTIGGYVVSLFGSIPEEGDIISDPSNSIKFEIMKMEGTRVEIIRARFKEKRSTRKEKRSGRFLSHPLCLCLSLSFFLFILSIPLAVATGGAAGLEGNRFGPGILVFSFFMILSLSLRAFFAGSETAVVSASKARMDALAEQGNSNALIIKNLWQKPDKMLGIILVGTNMMSTAAGVAGLQLVSRALPGMKGLQEFVNTFLMTFLILVFCEILPKTIFRARADSLALSVAPCLHVSGILLHPFVQVVTKITNYIVRIADKEEGSEKLSCMREELKLLAQMGEREGILKKEQLRMINSVLDLESMTIDKVMKPLIDIVALPKQTSLKEFYKTVSETGYSRIPVYEERVDNIIGIVNVLDVLNSDTPSETISPFIKTAIHNVPESKRVHSLLREIRNKDKDTSMVFVVDEYGGVVGLVTIEDLIEEILGDIWDEKDKEGYGSVRQISDNVIECDGKTEVDILNHTYNIPVPSGDYNTIAGYIISLLERIPKRGEFVRTKSLKIVVLEADSRSIRRVRIIKK